MARRAGAPLAARLTPLVIAGSGFIITLQIPEIDASLPSPIYRTAGGGCVPPGAAGNGTFGA